MKTIMTLLCLTIFLVGCDEKKPTLELPVEITKESNHLTIAWNWDPEDSDLTYDCFRLYYRAHGTGAWTLLEEIPIDTTSHTIVPEDLDYGVYDFAVTAVTSADNESDYHTSLDNNAEPTTGWYVNWIDPEL